MTGDALLPHVTEVQRLTLGPEDRLVVLTDIEDLRMDMVHEISRAVQQVLDTDVPVLVFPARWKLSVMMP